MSASRCICGSTSGTVRLRTGGHFAVDYALVRCGVCGLISPDPFPTAASLAELYQGYGNYTDPAYVATERARRRAHAVRLWKRTQAALGPGFQGPRRLLEVGCASGTLLWNLGQVSGWDGFGVEVDEVSGKAAAELMPGHVHVGTLESAAHPSGHFSALYLDQVIEHVADTVGLLRECRRLLARGGFILIGTPNFAGLSARLMKLEWKELDPREHVRMFTPSALRYHLTAVGFEQVRIRTGGLSFIRRRDRKDLLPISRERLPLRLAARLLSIALLGDGLQATARAPG